MSWDPGRTTLEHCLNLTTVSNYQLISMRKTKDPLSHWYGSICAFCTKYSALKYRSACPLVQQYCIHESKEHSTFISHYKLHIHRSELV